MRIRTGFAGGVRVAVCEFGIVALMSLFHAFTCLYIYPIIAYLKGSYSIMNVWVGTCACVHLCVYFAIGKNSSNYPGCNLLNVTAHEGLAHRRPRLLATAPAPPFDFEFVDRG